MLLKNNEKWIIDLPLNCKTIKLLGETYSRIGDLGFGNEILVTAPKARCRKGFSAKGRVSAKSLRCPCTCILKRRSERRQVGHCKSGGSWKERGQGTGKDLESRCGQAFGLHFHDTGKPLRSFMQDTDTI